MPNPTTFWDDIHDFLDDIEAREREDLNECKDHNCWAAGANSGAIDTIKRIRDWIKGDDAPQQST